MKEDKFFKVASSFSLSPVFLAVGLFIGNGLGLAGAASSLVTAGTAIAGSSITYFGINKFTNWHDKKDYLHHRFFHQDFLRHMQQWNQESTITEKTVDFSRFIKEVMNSGMNKIDIDMNGNNIDNINQLLFLINCNYFDKIKESHPNLKREELLMMITIEALNHLSKVRQNSTRPLNEKDMKKILSKCSILDDDMKKDIYKEYKDGKIFYDGKHRYVVCPNKEITSSDVLPKKEEKKFDLNNNSDYSLIIECASNRDEVKKVGDASQIEWDIDTLKNMMQVVIGDYSKSLSNLFEDFSNYNFVLYFVSELSKDAVRNNDRFIGVDEMFHTFKNLNGIPNNLRNEMLADISNEINVEQIKDRYRRNQKTKKIGSL